MPKRDKSRFGKEYHRDWRAKNPEKVRAHRDRSNATRKLHPEYKSRRRKYGLKALYGLSVEEFDRLLLAQGGVCGSCFGVNDARRTWHVDHCHTTGMVRGILCHGCNVALGMVRDSAPRLRQLAAYIEKFK